MTKSTITRERIEQYANDPRMCNINDEIRELARMALAAMDSEPVTVPEHITYISEPTILNILANDDSSPMAYAARLLAYEVRFWRSFPLYRHAQPAPVVQCPFPCGWDNLNKLAIQDAALVARGLVEGEITTEAHRQAAISNNERLLKVISACRAAMLAAAPHDTPALNSVQSVVTVPGKWIPVSERMPEDRTQVILWDAEIGEVTSGHYSHKTQTFYHCGDAIENEITHWMLPPSAPQGVKP
ncbi:DUF551 domain-containing protein [Klebsiella variicola]|uniref:DUF551 domain-containing protein n=1 Tax=Klebsiella variicola TaxID=244366 RepID=UPI002379A106|nr:DUF551 domain-containing protein [Klebsiella variicola]MDD9249119.1 DUF551 domain-containing protein [Klebsiella variicola]